MAQVFVENAVRRGFDFETANKLFCATMEGSAKMILEAGKTHQELIDMVSSKGGTTLAMSSAMKESGFEESLLKGFDACVERAKELGV
jgi:pyrroline-5-carboxylate reductase